MSKICITTSCCNNGDVLAEDIYNRVGVTLVHKNTVINEYIKYRLKSIGICCVWIYDHLELHEERLQDKRYTIIKNSYKSTIMMVKKILLELSSGRTIEYGEVDIIVNTIYDSINEKSAIIQTLAEIKYADVYTYTHCVNVALYSMLIAKWLNFSEVTVKKVIVAGLLHDIGKIKVPIEILNKKDKLSQKEFELIKRHSEYGYEMIKDRPEIDYNVSLGVRQHHERMDGSGYPDKLKGNDIGIYGRIVAVADVYDAMTQNRVYKKGVTPFDAFEMFMTSGMQYFDLNVLSVFIKYLPVYFTEARVLLNNNVKGKIVYIPPTDILNPVVQAKTNFIDLSKEKQIKIVSIL